MSAAALAAILALSTGCTGLQNWKADVENAAASNACNDAGWTEATGRHQECIVNTRAAMVEQQRQDTQTLLVGSAAVAAFSGLSRQSAPAEGQRLRRASLVNQRYENYQWICQYQTETGPVHVASSNGCAAEYFY